MLTAMDLKGSSFLDLQEFAAESLPPATLRARRMDPDDIPLVWPAEVNFILSSLDAAQAVRPPVDRRGGGRHSYRTAAGLRLFSDRAAAVPWMLFSRDFTPSNMGFVTRYRLSLGYGGVLHLRGPDNTLLQIDCTVQRCRPSVRGWFEGAVHFNRAQPSLMELLAAVPPAQ